MIGRLLLGLAVTPAKPKARKPKPAGWIGTLGVALCVGLLMFGNITHDWTVMWFIALPGICSVLIMTGWAVTAQGRNKAIDAALNQIPAPEAPVTSAELRERAAQLEVPAVVPAPRQGSTYRQLLTGTERYERYKRVAGILMATCPACAAVSADLCTDAGSDAPVYQLDLTLDIKAHGARIGTAIKAGTASITDVVAQFEGSVPDDVWEYAL